MANRVVCKHNPGAGCEDTTKCGTCGWNPEVARRRIRACFLKQKVVDDGKGTLR